MTLSELLQAGFKKVKSEHMLESLNYLDTWGFKKKAKVIYDEMMDETYTAWFLSKEDFMELFGGSNVSPFGTTIMGFNILGEFYASPMILEFCQIARIAATEQKYLKRAA
jgi:hypothetical protein